MSQQMSTAFEKNSKTINKTDKIKDSVHRDFISDCRTTKIDIE